MIEGRFTVRPTFRLRPPALRADGGQGSVLFEAGIAAAGQRLARPRASRTGPRLVTFRLSAGETAYLVLTHGEDDEGAAIEDLAGADRRIATTEEYWRRWSARCTYRGRCPYGRPCCARRSA